MGQKVYAVIGAGFGDEGKGQTVDYILNKKAEGHEKESLVVRYSGGPQASHTVYSKAYGKHHAFSSIGSGTFRGTKTLWSRFCTLEPTHLLMELDILEEELGVPIPGSIFVDRKVPIITPWDMAYDQVYRKAGEHLSCGFGHGVTLTREENHYSLLAEDMLHPWIFQEKVKIIKDYYLGSFLTKKAVDPNRELNFFKAIDALMEQRRVFISDSSRDVDIIRSQAGTNRDEPGAIIFEGSQGLMLDKDIGMFPFVTWSNTGTKNIMSLLGNDPTYGYIDEIYLVTRAYQTRHGSGPMVGEDRPYSIEKNPEENNVVNPYQGEFKIGILNLDQLKYVLNKDENLRKTHFKYPGRLHLVVTCLDHVQKDLRFILNGQIHGFSSELRFLEAIVKELSIHNLVLSHSPYAEDMKEVIL